VIERSAELLQADTDPHALADSELFDLGRTLVWTTADASAQTGAPSGQAGSVEAAAKVRADADRGDSGESKVRVGLDAVRT
jgi:hypothetical protein